MSNKLQKELDKNRFFIVKNGLIIMILVIILVLVMLALLKVEDESILSAVWKYYFKD